MKKLISLCAAVGVAASALATGNLGVNPPQSGVLTVTNAASVITNQFAEAYTVAPCLVVYSSLTNGTPVTNNFVTTTNFAISFPTGGTNSAFAWQAFVGATCQQSGTFVDNGVLVTNTFTYPYYSTPVLLVSGTATNNPVAVTSVTTTNFITLCGTSNTVSWISVGTVLNPTSENVGQFPPAPKLIVTQ
jgi:hypothetical protein